MKFAYGTPEKLIEAFIGAWGIRTGSIASADELLFSGSRVFEISAYQDAADLARQIDALGKKERKRLAAKNLLAVFGDAGRFSPDWSPSTAAPPAANPASIESVMATAKPQLIDGRPFGIEGSLDVDPATLLRKVVSAVISAGQGHILYEFPDVLAFFGARIPNRDELVDHHKVDDRMFDRKGRESSRSEYAQEPEKP